MKRLVKDMAGQRFGRLEVIKRAGSDKNGNARWLCRCDCGSDRVVLGQSLRNGATQSCGCLNKEIVSAIGVRHGRCKTPAYKAWHGMIQRCRNPNNHKWERYGGRGVRVCERWLVYANFLADMGERPEGMTIDRINNDGDYEPANCRWATPQEQASNKGCNRYVEIDGDRLTFSEASRKYGVSLSTARYRLRAGWELNDIFKKPVKTNCKETSNGTTV